MRRGVRCDLRASRSPRPGNADRAFAVAVRVEWRWPLDPDGLKTYIISQEQGRIT